MSKRGAASELNDRNWDDDVEPEEAGQFVQAATEVLQKRQIVKARRKNPEDKASGGSTTFSGFSGFALKPTTGSDATNSLFSFGKTNSSEMKDSTNNSATNTDSQNDNADAGKPLVNGGSKDTSKKSAYYQSLKSLNASVVTWITKHVEKNPYCILTPIFKDYEKHMERLESEKKDEQKEESVKSENSSETKKVATETSGFNFGSFSSTTGSFSSTTGSIPAFSGFNFSSTSDDQKPAFSFAITKQSSTLSQGATASQGDEEEYVPPKPEVEEVKEEGSFYTKRCKLFYQKEGDWKERGVGNLHLKSCDNEKTQLIVRADTSLGNILLNIMLGASMPVKRQGKNNVSILCIPNPPVDPKADPEKPVSMLIRVKTESDADELAKKLEDAK